MLILFTTSLKEFLIFNITLNIYIIILVELKLFLVKNHHIFIYL